MSRSIIIRGGIIINKSKTQRLLILFFVVTLLISFQSFFAPVTVKAIVDGDWYVCIFDEYPDETHYFNESVSGEKWLECKATGTCRTGTGVTSESPPASGGDKWFCNANWDGAYTVYSSVHTFYFEKQFLAMAYDEYAETSTSGVFNNHKYFRRSDGVQLFHIYQFDNVDSGSRNYWRLYDENDAQIAAYSVLQGPGYSTVNITLNVTTQEILVDIWSVTHNNEIIYKWFNPSTFDYISQMHVTGGGDDPAECYFDDLRIYQGEATPPPQLWQVGYSEWAGCANCEHDGYHQLTFASTNTFVVESDFDVFVPGRYVLQIALGIESSSDIADVDAWLRIGDEYSEEYDAYYTYGTDKYIVVWENVNTIWYESQLPLEFKFVSTDTSDVINLLYEHSDNDGDGDIQYKFQMDGNNYNGVYDGDNTMGRDLCIEIYSGWDWIGGDVNISVFNASKPSEALEGWNVTVVNKVTGLVEYNESNCNNVLTINTSDIGIGHRLFYISNESYYTRIYYAYIEPFINYTLNAYLLHETIGRYYCFRVLSGATEFGYQLPVYDAQINISRFIVGQGLTLVENLFTDQNGYAVTYLIPGEMYYFNITKEGYTTEITNFVVAQNKEDCYEFIIEGIIPSGPGYDNWYQNISLTAQMISAGYLQLGNITVNYSDANYSTIDTHTYIYEVYNNTRTFMNYSYDYNNSFDLKFGDINTTRTHHVVLFYNNTATFIDQTSPVVIVLNPVHTYIGERNPFSFDGRVKNIIGPFTIKPDIWHEGIDIPWGHILAAIIGIIPLCIFGQKHTAIAIIASGMAIGGLDVFFSIWFTDTFPVLLISLAPLLVVLGGVYHKVKGDTL